MAPKLVTSPVPEAWYRNLAVSVIPQMASSLPLCFSSMKVRLLEKIYCLAKELTEGAVAFVFLRSLPFHQTSCIFSSFSLPALFVLKQGRNKKKKKKKSILFPWLSLTENMCYL